MEKTFKVTIELQVNVENEGQLHDYVYDYFHEAVKSETLHFDYEQVASLSE